MHERVKSGLTPKDFTLRSIFARLDRGGDLWSGLRMSEPANLEAVFAYEDA